MDVIVSIFRKLKLEKIPKKWSTHIWESEFTENPNLDSFDDSTVDEDLDTYDDINFEYSTFLDEIDVWKVYKEITNASLKWLNDQSKKSPISNNLDSSKSTEDLPIINGTISGSSLNVSITQEDTGFWQLLTKEKIQYKSLVALLFHHMEIGQKRGLGTPEMRTGFQATELYFLLLSIPGSSAFKIFHPILYSKALDILKFSEKLIYKNTKKKSRSAKSSQASQSRTQGRRNTQQRSQRREFSDDSDSVDDDVGEENAPIDTSVLLSSLHGIVEKLMVMLDNFSLKASIESLETTIQQLVKLTHAETNTSNLELGLNRNRNEITSFLYNAYMGLSKLCQPLHGIPDKTQIPLVLQSLVPSILMTVPSLANATLKDFIVIRDRSLNFVRYLINTVGPSIYPVVEILIQHIAVRVPDKAEYRQKASLAIVDLLTQLPKNVYSQITMWFFRLSHSEKIVHRQFTIELMGQLLNQPERSDIDHNVNERGEGSANIMSERLLVLNINNEANESVNEREQGSSSNQHTASTNENSKTITNRFLFSLIYSRCNDISPTVRSKSLHVLAEVTAANNSTVAEVIKNMLTVEETNDNQNENNFQFSRMIEDSNVDLSTINPLPNTSSFIAFVRSKALDDSANVRKNALQVLENILKFNFDVDEITNNGDILFSSKYGMELVGILCEHCRDPSLMVRKQMVSSLTDVVVLYPENDSVIEKWVEGIFPLVLDVEQRVSERVEECIWECALGNLVSLNKCRDKKHFLIWRILSATERLKMSKYLGKACASWASNGLLKPSILDVLKTHVVEGSENTSHAWLLLGLVSAHIPLKDPQFVMEYFNSSIHHPQGVGLYTLLQVLKVLLASISYLKDDEMKSLQKDLITLIQNFSMPPELISTAVDICTMVSSLDASRPQNQGTASKSKQNKEQDGNIRHYHKLLEGWAVEIIEKIDHELSEKLLHTELIAGERTSNGRRSYAIETSQMSRQIFTLGELAQICPLRINKRLFLLMQHIVYQEGVKGGGRKNRKTLEQDTYATQFGITQTQSFNPGMFKPSTKMQALTIITLAKMCIQNEPMAKKIIPVFGRLLSTTSDTAIRNNILYAIADMSIRYASLVDPLLPNVTSCLKSDSITVRRTALVTLVNLLQEDYIKMSGGLFLRILQTLLDESEEIVSLSIFYIQQRLIKRKPKIMYSHFLEAVFHFNEYSEHKSYNKFIVTEKERELFSLAGSNMKNDRMKLYKFMLEHMIDAERFQMTYKLCKEILQGAVEGSVMINGSESIEVLQDTFACLACEEIKLASLKVRNENNDDIETTPQADVDGTIKRALISQQVKRNVIENIVPIIISLKHKLQEAKSPLLDDLMTYLRELMKDYKNEVDEILESDKQTAAEITFDLRKWEEEQTQKLTQEEHRDEREITEEDMQNCQLREVLVKAISNQLRRRSIREIHANDGNKDTEHAPVTPRNKTISDKRLEGNEVISKPDNLNNEKIITSLDRPDSPSNLVTEKRGVNTEVEAIPENQQAEVSNKDLNSLEEFIEARLSPAFHRQSSRKPQKKHPFQLSITPSGSSVITQTAELQLSPKVSLSDSKRNNLQSRPKETMTCRKDLSKSQENVTDDQIDKSLPTDIMKQCQNSLQSLRTPSQEIPKTSQDLPQDRSFNNEKENYDATINQLTQKLHHKKSLNSSDNLLHEKSGSNERNKQNTNVEVVESGLSKGNSELVTEQGVNRRKIKILTSSHSLNDITSESSFQENQSKPSGEKCTEVSLDSVFQAPQVVVSTNSQNSICSKPRPSLRFRLKGVKSASSLRAISTPTKNATILRENVTFNVAGVANCTDDPSLANISEIPNLSPPTPGRLQAKRSRTSTDISDKLTEGEVNESFQFLHGKKDAFDKILPKNSQNLQIPAFKKSSRNSCERLKNS